MSFAQYIIVGTHPLLLVNISSNDGKRNDGGIICSLKFIDCVAATFFVSSKKSDIIHRFSEVEQAKIIQEGFISCYRWKHLYFVRYVFLRLQSPTRLFNVVNGLLDPPSNLSWNVFIISNSAVVFQRFLLLKLLLSLILTNRIILWMVLPQLIRFGGPCRFQLPA